MGQLIKLQDCTSRYEQNIFHYPSRFVTLKKQQWEQLKSIWENPERQLLFSQNAESNVIWHPEEKHSVVKKMKTFFTRKHERETERAADSSLTAFQMEDSITVDMLSAIVQRADTIEELKQQFLNQLFDFQMKWATSTLMEKSFVNKKFYYDERLKFFLQRFPDTYLVLHLPVFLLKKAAVELETILISPTEVWCITFLEDRESSVFVGSNQKFWTVRSNHKEKKMVNPMIALNRTEKIVQSIFQLHEIDLPVHKVLLSRNGFIDYPSAPYAVNVIDKRKYEDWFQSLRDLRSPLKHIQLKGAQALLRYCQTISTKRVEWGAMDGK